MLNRGICCLLFAAISAFGQVSILPIGGSLTSSTSLPPVGLVVGDTAQVNFVNNSPVSSTATTTSTTQSCTGTVAFYNAAGAMIGKAIPFTVPSGQIVPVSLPYASSEASGRILVRAVISLPALSAPTPTSTSTLTPPLAPVFPVPCSLSYSYEVYDSSNVTHVFVTGTVAQGLAGVLSGILEPIANR